MDADWSEAKRCPQSKLHVVDGRWRSIAYQAIMLSRSELGLLIKGMRVLGHLLNLGELKLLLGQKIIYGLWILRRDVVDLSEIFFLRHL